MGELGGAVEAEGEAYGADAAVDVELHLVDAEEAGDVLLAHWRQDHRAEKREAYLAAVGVAGEHDVDKGATGMTHDFVGEVGRVAHEDDRAVGIAGDGEVEDRILGARVVHAAEPETLTVALDGDVLVDEERNAGSAESVGHKARADEGVVIAEDTIAEGAGDAGDDLGTVIDGSSRERIGKWTHRGEIASEQHEIRRKLVDAVDDEPEEGSLRVLVEVNVRDLDDAETAEGFGQASYLEGLRNDFDGVAGDLAGVEDEAG